MVIKYSRVKIFLLLSLILGSGVMFNSCDGDEGESSAIQINSFGPSPNLRGGQLRFIGKNLDKVTSVMLPGSVEVSEFVSKTSTMLIIEIPQATAKQGKVMLKTQQGDIETKSMLFIAEPITISSFSPATLRPGDELTITGTYLNLVHGVVFKDNRSVTEFESQSATEVKVIVPEDAQTGIFALLGGNVEDPFAVESETDLTVKIPAISSVAPTTVKAGSNLTITGTDLDLVKNISFQGGINVASFVSQTASELVVAVPSNSRDGKLVLRLASAVEVESPAITMAIPAISSFTPNPAKNGQNITIEGTNLDLVTSVEFGGSVDGTIQDSGTPTSISVKVPPTAVNGIVTLHTAADKSVVTTSDLTLVIPTISSFTPTTVSTASSPSITINGTDLDIVEKIIFEGGWSANVSGTASQITVNVVPGSLTGKVKLVTFNGTEIVSDQTLTINPHIPNITGYPTEAFIGGLITLTGTNMNVPSDVIFPGNIKATLFGTKSETVLEVYVPQAVGVGDGKIKFVTFKNEVYESPMISFKFPGTEPIVDPLLVIYNFDETGLADNHNHGWDNWNGLTEVGDNPAIAVSGKYLHGVSANASGYWVWGCNHSQLPKKSVSKAGHLFKVDVKITKALPANANFRMILGGNNIDIGNLGQTTPNGNWVTLTFDLSDYAGLPATIPASGDWGMAIAGGTPMDITGLYMDNFRFQAK